MRAKTRRAQQDTSISFLDIICCGFGAIVLLLVIVKPIPLDVLEESLIDNAGQVRALQERLFAIRGQIDYLESELNAKQEQLGKTDERVAILRSQLDTLKPDVPIATNGEADAKSVEELQIALQTLTAEMKRLLRDRRRPTNHVAGVPADSEYIVFIIDTSGSMQQSAWNRMLREVRTVLAIYPRVKGIQVMNADGRYLFSELRGEWLRDSVSMRRRINDALAVYRQSSKSTPVDGILTAIRSHFQPGRKISLYVFGDDYEGRTVARVLEIVRELNRRTADGDTLVRIHTVGFPVQFGNGFSYRSNAARYAQLMRELAEQNNGAFIGLNSTR